MCADDSPILLENWVECMRCISILLYNSMQDSRKPAKRDITALVSLYRQWRDGGVQGINGFGAAVKTRMLAKCLLVVLFCYEFLRISASSEIPQLIAACYYCHLIRSRSTKQTGLTNIKYAMFVACLIKNQDDKSTIKFSIHNGHNI